MSAIPLWYYGHGDLLGSQRSKDAIVVKIELSCTIQYINIGYIVIRLACSTFAGRPPSESFPHPTTWNSWWNLLVFPFLSDPCGGSDLEEAKLWLWLLFFLGPLGLTAKTVQIFTSGASQTYITIIFRKLKTRTIHWRPRDDNDKDTRKDKDKDKDKDRTFKKKVFLYI